MKQKKTDALGLLTCTSKLTSSEYFFADVSRARLPDEILSQQFSTYPSTIAMKGHRTLAPPLMKNKPLTCADLKMTKPQPGSRDKTMLRTRGHKIVFVSESQKQATRLVAKTKQFSDANCQASEPRPTRKIRLLCGSSANTFGSIPRNSLCLCLLFTC